MGCVFCENADFGRYTAKVEKMDGGLIQAGIAISGGSGRFPKEDQFSYCPACGENLTTVKMKRKLDGGGVAETARRMPPRRRGMIK